MTENSPGDEHPDSDSESLDRALAENQKLEREERNADLEKMRKSDERIVRALSKE